jgi:hypothetical protein
MGITVISSFYNEEYLLPWWLECNKKVFDHGILFNYFSNDKSVEIIKRICPTWEIINTKQKMWSDIANEEDVTSAEKTVDGFKINIAITEFVIQVKQFTLLKSKKCYAIPMYVMVDTKPEDIPTYKKSLIEQKKTGYLSEKNKYRFLHNYTDGAYSTYGRHRTTHKLYQCFAFIIFKYAYSPWNKDLIKRKLSMKTNCDPYGKHGKHHLWGGKRLLEEYNKLLTKDLKDYELPAFYSYSS